ncbi:PQQ-dependent dehydrogenase (s-GDH family) [Mesocricetibacter intestinalis]|uniref:PQQ-dependent dehydrogenase (S-GDH family) n=1 Tax=Mesocricetibacter intestinalis TaxID=1521930 RepID=A0A4R6VCW6_9PAST|nr:glucose/sorbosone family PQQ-dependent dehydrogenase [Mesocricetibacter intestinalis]TDQ59804.1 PQQ-dependent dehydrogenase (s-GDH family) [Mesocricetibacter intestinalis]
MKKTLSAIAIATALFSINLYAENTVVQNPRVANIEQDFKSSVLVDGLDGIWDMVWGADGKIWITERQGRRISSIDPQSGEHKVLYTFEKAFAQPVHQGVLGMAFDPDFLKGKGEDYVYVYYTYAKKPEDGKSTAGRIVRLHFDAKAGTLRDEQIVLDNLTGGDDHNGGRLMFDKKGKLLATFGDSGFNQYANSCKEIRAQKLPSAEQVAKGDFSNYRGKILRLNKDGSIPADNPSINGVKSHIWAYGFRNPQGLVWVGDLLFNVDQGPGVDDEVNLIEKGGNYGWPHIAGYQDNQAYSYVNYSQVDNCTQAPVYDEVTVPDGVKAVYQKETDVHPDNFKPPLKTFYTVPNSYNFNDPKCGGDYICWPTVATTSIAYYPKDGKIKSLQNSLLVTGVKTGILYQLPLSGDSRQVQGEVLTHFRTSNRYRMVLVSPDSSKIYIATDSSGYIMGKELQPTDKVDNQGAILVFEAK